MFFNPNVNKYIAQGFRCDLVVVLKNWNKFENCLSREIGSIKWNRHQTIKCDNWISMTWKRVKDEGGAKQQTNGIPFENLPHNACFSPFSEFNTMCSIDAMMTTLRQFLYSNINTPIALSIAADLYPWPDYLLWMAKK